MPPTNTKLALFALPLALLLIIPMLPLPGTANAPLIAPASSTSGSSIVPTFTMHPAPSSLAGAATAGEPSIGINPASGATFFQAGTRTLKATFSGTTATWSDATPLSTRVFNLDPILFTDRVTGRTFAGGLNGQCSILAMTDNDGGSWGQVGNSCAGSDHETIGGGPWHSPTPVGATYSRAVYYCAQSSKALCATSLDGGVSFGPAVPVLGACSGLHGHVKVGPDGTAYLPSSNCGGKVGGGISSDNGQTWTSYTIAASTAAANGFDPSVATTPDGTLYEAFQGADNHPYAARSTDHGATWDRVTDLSTTWDPPLVSSTFQAMVAGDNDRAAIAFLGSTTGGNPFASSWSGVWHLFVSFTYDGGTTWQTVQATSDPVQRGWICAGGISCTSGRNLLDFMDANVDAQGRVVVAFADGCITTCAGPSGVASQSRSAYATLARQGDGFRMFAAFDPSGPFAPDAPTLTAVPDNGKVELAWSTPDDHGAAITSYRIYRATGSGTLAYLGSTTTTTMTDTSPSNGVTYRYAVAGLNSVGEGPASLPRSATPSGTNAAPTPCFAHAESLATTLVNASCSSDSDGSIVAWLWDWGDASTGTGKSAEHTYASGGTYTVRLTVRDDASFERSSTASITVATDPDPGATTLTNGVMVQRPTGAAGDEVFFKIDIPASQSQLTVVLDGPNCGLLGCNPQMDLSVRVATRPTSTSYTCSAADPSTNDEACALSSPASGWWYVRVHTPTSTTSGGTYRVTATYT